MPPRRGPRGTTQQSQRSAPSQRIGDVSEEEQESDDDVQPSYSRRAPKRTRLEIDVPASVLSWAQKGLYDLPAIPDYSGDAGNNDDNDDRLDKAALLAKMILLKHHKKEPFTNNQLLNDWRKAGQGDKDRGFDEDFSQARKLLSDDFGYLLAEIVADKPMFPMVGHGEAKAVATPKDTDAMDVDDDDDGGAGPSTQKKRPKKTFILVNSGEVSFVGCGRSSLPSRRKLEPAEAATMSLLTLTLLFIYMEGDGESSEEYLWLFLKPFGFDQETNHRLIGNVKNVLNSTFIKQQYIVKQMVQKGENVELYYYRWGPRADLEFSKVAMLNL
ncbi:hypothetical protein RvY_07652-2 [Ramazzottius varieornatus]|nr:hypothetical protein RvY_07652-2 [Ramazzottius varieornatus]